MSGYYIYRHLDINDTILYIGLTTDMRNRQHRHILSSEWNKFIDKIEYFDAKNEMSMKILEKYLINYYNPEFNVKDANNDDIEWLNINVPEFIAYKDEELKLNSNQKIKKRRKKRVDFLSGINPRLLTIAISKNVADFIYDKLMKSDKEHLSIIQSFKEYCMKHDILDLVDLTHHKDIREHFYSIKYEGTFVTKIDNYFVLKKGDNLKNENKKVNKSQVKIWKFKEKEKYFKSQ